MYNILLAFSFYWLANLILWIPWTINPYLGMTIMLTIGPFLWGLAVYYCLIRYKGKNMWEGALLNAAIFTIVAVLMDYVFFVLIRDSIEDLYHPTTFYAYAFLIVLPFLEIWLFRKLLSKKKRIIKSKDFLSVAFLGAFSLLLLIAIIKFNIQV